MNLDKIPAELRQWAEEHLVPELEDWKARLLSLENAAKDQAQQVLASAQRELERVQAEAPSLGDKAQGFITAAENAVADAEALLAKFGPTGM